MKSFFVKIAVFAFSVFAVFSLVQLQLRINSLESEYETALEEVEKLEDQKEKLENERASLDDEEHIVEVAKEKLNLRLPEEIIFYNDLYN